MQEQRETSLDEQRRLLYLHIENGQNDEAKAMLNKELAQEYDKWSRPGSLLHHAAEQNNAVIARKLIELGADVNLFGGYNDSPLVTAVEHRSAAVVQVLLEAGASIDMIDYTKRGALNVALDSYHMSPEIVEMLVGKLRTEAGTNEKLAAKLIAAMCNMHHAAALRDVDLMECMLKHGVDVNSKSPAVKTALHAAVGLEDVNLANWLLNKGADVDAVDFEGFSALARAAESGNKVMVELLLERGAYPNVKGKTVHDFYRMQQTPLYVAFSRLTDRPDKFVECAEILFQHGATLPVSFFFEQIFYFALDCPCDKAAKLLFAHLAMLEMLGKPYDQDDMESVMYSLDERHRTKMLELWKYYEPCQQVLMTKVFGKLSLLDLMKESDRKMRLLVRKETFLQEVEKVSLEHKLSELYLYYYNRMMRRIEKAKRVVKLEDEASLVICKIFEATYNQFYGFARDVVEYLSERDLEHLVQV